MITVHLASYLRTFADGRSAVTVDGDCRSVADVLARLWQLAPGVRHRVVDEAGHVRQHVNVFVGQDNVRDRQGLDTPVADGAELWILPAVSGG
jgi:molybdopterin converting factor small subunit